MPNRGKKKKEGDSRGRRGNVEESSLLGVFDLPATVA